MPENAAANEASNNNKKRSRLVTMLVLVVGVAVVEGIGFYAATKLLGGGPQVAYGEEEGRGNVLDGEQASVVPRTVEVEVLTRFKVPNDKRGRLYIYDFDLALKVPSEREAEATRIVTEHQREMSDRVARIVRAADPAVLHEPELKSLRLQLQRAMGEVAGSQDLIIEVLIPRCVPIRSD